MSWRQLFSGSRFIFWALTPFLLLFAIVMPLTIVGWTQTKIVLVALLDILALLLAFGLYNPMRNEWALRIVTGLVFSGYASYVASEIYSGAPLRLSGSEAEVSLRNSLLGLVLIGWPCIKFTLQGFDGWRSDHDHLGPN
jgi:hypothetical protein